MRNRIFECVGIGYWTVLEKLVGSGSSLSSRAPRPAALPLPRARPRLPRRLMPHSAWDIDRTEGLRGSLRVLPVELGEGPGQRSLAQSRFRDLVRPGDRHGSILVGKGCGKSVEGLVPVRGRLHLHDGLDRPLRFPRSPVRERRAPGTRSQRPVGQLCRPVLRNIQPLVAHDLTGQGVHGPPVVGLRIGNIIDKVRGHRHVVVDQSLEQPPLDPGRKFRFQS